MLNVYIILFFYILDKIFSILLTIFLKCSKIIKKRNIWRNYGVKKRKIYAAS